MTGIPSEQNQQWQALYVMAALLPEPAEFLEQSLQASNERLAGRGVPEWAIYLREVCALRSWKSGREDSHWVPEFLDRSETALIGLTLRYTHPDEAEAAFQRLCVRYVHEELQPFVVHAETLGWSKRSRYKWAVKLHRLCERYLTQGNAFRMPKHLGSLPRRVFYLCFGYVYVSLYIFVGVSGSLLFGRHELSRADPKPSKGFNTYFMSEALLRGINGVLDPRPSKPGKYDSSGHNLCLICELETLYCWMYDGREYSEHSYTHLYAAAYLAALETECPPPDWLLVA